jgi:hypothetical protein
MLRSLKELPVYAPAMTEREVDDLGRELRAGKRKQRPRKASGVMHAHHFGSGGACVPLLIRGFETGFSSHLIPSRGARIDEIVKFAAWNSSQGRTTVVSAPNRGVVRMLKNRLDQIDGMAAEAHEQDPEKAVERWDEHGFDDESPAYGPEEGDRMKAQCLIIRDFHLRRRGFSTYLYSIHNMFNEWRERGVPFDLVIYSLSQFIEQCRWEIAAEGRGLIKSYPSGVTKIKPVARCPVSSQNGSCEHCSKENAAQFRDFLEDSLVPILAPLSRGELGPDGKRNYYPSDCLKFGVSSNPDEFPDILIGKFQRVADTTSAARVLNYSRDNESLPSINIYKRESGQPPEEEDTRAVLVHLLESSHCPFLVIDQAHDRAGELSPEKLIERKAERAKKKWKEGIRFPCMPCDVHRLLLTDTLPFLQLADYVESGVRVLAFDGALSTIDREFMRDVLPSATMTEYQWSGSKIDQAAILFPGGHIGRQLLVGGDGKLVTHTLEAQGVTVIQLASALDAARLSRTVGEAQPTVRHIRDETYGRYVESHGLNRQQPGSSVVMGALSPAATGMEFGEGNAVLIINAAAYYARASFNIDGLSREVFAALKAEEVAMMILRNIEQGFHCNAGKLLPIVILNAGSALRRAISRLSILAEGAERPPAIQDYFKKDEEEEEEVDHEDVSMPQVIDVVKRWQDQGGGKLPDVDPNIETNDGRGRSKQWTQDAMREEARVMHARRIKWREYQNWRRPGKIFGPEFEKELKETIWG